MIAKVKRQILFFTDVNKIVHVCFYESIASPSILFIFKQIHKKDFQFHTMALKSTNIFINLNNLDFSLLNYKNTNK